MTIPKDCLKPEDFPLERDGKKLYQRGKSKPVIEAASEKIAKDIGDRLNLDEAERHEDGWSL
jgi:hypothetical protein